MASVSEAESASFWKSTADRHRVENDHLRALLEDASVQVAETTQALASAQTDVAEVRRNFTYLQNLLASQDLDVEVRKVKEDLSIAQANIVELRQLVEAERNRAQRFSDLWSVALVWSDARRTRDRVERAAVDVRLLRAIDELAAQVPH